MPANEVAQIHNEGQMRHFFQPGGARPSSEFLYAGVNGDYMYIPSFSAPNPRGDITPINIQDPRQQESWAQIGVESTAPDFANFDAVFMPRRGGVPRELYGALVDCNPTFYQSVTECSDPSDLMIVKTDYITIASRAHNTTRTQGGGGGQNSAMVNHTLSFKQRIQPYLVGGLYFGGRATTQITREIVDVVYASRIRCGLCGPNDDGSKLWYAVVINAAATAEPLVVYSVNGTIATSAITGAADTDVPIAIRVAGNYLFVAFQDATGGGYFLATINKYTGAPENWQKITTGFSTGNEPNDVYVRNTREVFFVGDGGYIFKSTNLSQGVSVIDDGQTTTENLNRIKGVGDTIVIGADSDVVLVSSNSGRTFATVATAPGVANVTAVEVVSPLLFWVGDSAGLVRHTETLGNSWVTTAMPAAATSIQEIAFVTDEIGYVLAANATPRGLLFTTPNGGELWGQAGNTWRLNNYPDTDRANRLAYPQVPNLSVACNNLLIGGLADDGSDGFVTEAVTNLV